jgi:SAM-dependent methyltransferase
MASRCDDLEPPIGKTFMDAIAQFKENAKQAWSTFASIEMVTGSVATRLVKFAGIARGMKVLDVACGSGVVALTAARVGAAVTGVDLTPELIEHAKENASLMRLEVEWHVGDVEALPFGDARFDAVVSQFGHIFAPRPEIAIQEMLRVLRPGGTIAFSTWPPELMFGRMFALMAKYGPPPIPGVSPPAQWGDPSIVRERLGGAVRNLGFDRHAMYTQTLSVQHQRLNAESRGPLSKLVQSLEATDPGKLAELRREVEELLAVYFEDNHIRQDFLMTRAVKI